MSLEHVNTRLPDQHLATLFYMSGLGLTRDPSLMPGVDKMWANVGRSQFHLPTGGPHGDFDLMVALLLERNRFRNVAFDSILVDAPRGTIPGWAGLATASGGRSTTAELEALAQGGSAPARGG